MNRPSLPPSVPLPYGFGYPPPHFTTTVSPVSPVSPLARPAPVISGFDPRATASLILGVVSLLTGAFAGVPAFILGSQARRDEERLRTLYPHVPRRVGGVALAGMLTGAIGTVLGVALIAGTGGYWYAQKQARAMHPSYSLHGSNAPAATSPHAPVSSFGSIRVVDLAEDDTLPFRDRIKEELKTAHEGHHPVIVETTASFSHTCDEINAAFTQAPLQRALAGATVVRVDVETFEAELRSSGMWQDTVPWFYRLDSNLHPTDAISADEWDENTAENMAKVLGPFAHGTLSTRRSPSPLTTSL